MKGSSLGTIGEALAFAEYHAANPDSRLFHWSALAYDLRRRYGENGRALLDAGLAGYPQPRHREYRDETWRYAALGTDGHPSHHEPRPHFCDESLVTRMIAWRESARICARVEQIKKTALATEQFARDMREGKIPMPTGSHLPSSPLAHAAPVLQSAAALRKKTFAPVHYVVPGYVAEGCTILAGRPKVGKSWIMLDVGLAVAAGGLVLGTKAEQGDVLYLGLEDNERRLKSRISKILGPFVDWPSRFQYATAWPRCRARRTTRYGNGSRQCHYRA